MTESLPRTSRRSARATAASRPTPTVRPLSDSDFFAWVGLYSGYLSQMGVPFTDERALRTWQSLHHIAELEAFVVERSGHLAGFTYATPLLNPFDGFLALEIGAIYVEQMDSDGAALETLVGALHEHAASIGATKLLWRLPPSNDSYLRMSRQFGALTEFGTYEMPVQR